MKAKKITITIDRRDLDVLQAAVIEYQNIYAGYLESAEDPQFIRELVENFQSAARLKDIAMRAAE